MLLINPSSLGDYSIHYGNILATKNGTCISTLIGGKNYSYGQYPKNVVVDTQRNSCQYYYTASDCRVKSISIHDEETFSNPSNVYHINRSDDIERFKLFIFSKNMLLNAYALTRNIYNTRIIKGRKRFIVLVNSNILQAFLESGLHNIFTEDFKNKLNLEMCFLVIPDIKMTNAFIKYNCTLDDNNRLVNIQSLRPIQGYYPCSSETRNDQNIGYTSLEDYIPYFKNKYSLTMPITNLDINWALRMLFKKKELPSGFIYLETSLGDTCEPYFNFDYTAHGNNLDLRKKILYDACNSEVIFISKHDDEIIVTADSYRSSIELLNNMGESNVIKL